VDPGDTGDAPAAPAPRKRTRWTWLLLLLTLVGGGVAAARLGPQLSPEWEAVSLLRFDPQPFPRLFPDAAAPVSGDAYLVMRDEYCRTRAALAKSRRVLLEALRSEKVAKLALLKDLGTEPVDWLEQNLQAGFPDSPQVMRISLRSSKHTEDLVPLVEAVTQAYFKEIVDKDKTVREEQLRVLTDVGRRFEDRIKGIRRVQRDLQERVGPGDKPPSFQQEQARADYEDAKAELTRTRGELRRLRVREARDRDRLKAATEAERNAKLEKVREEIESLQELEKRLEADAERLAKPNKIVPGTALDLSESQRELAEKEDTLKAIRKRVSMLEVELQAPSSASIEVVLRKVKGK
jgi:hypothetical protein